MAMENDKLFVELEASQWIKTGQAACGDDFRCVRIPNEKRTIAVLSDGLGSGIKANLMASMTCSSAGKPASWKWTIRPSSICGI